jgi:hypothetical protein
MAKDSNENASLKALIEYYRNEFRTSENLNNYLPKDLKIAERKFLKFKLDGKLRSSSGGCSGTNDSPRIG